MIVQCTRCAYQAIRRMSDTWARSSGNHHTPGRDATRAAPGEGDRMTLIETMEAEGWRFGAPCHSYMACTMQLHMIAPDGRRAAVVDEDALARFFGDPERRALFAAAPVAQDKEGE